MKKNVKTKKKQKVPAGMVFIQATFNNTIVTITDNSGNVVAWSSAGKMKFSGFKKSSAFAATIVAQDAAKSAIALGMKEVEVNIKGLGAGREPAVRALQSAGLVISTIKDVTPVAFNGCRPQKLRRV